MLNNEEIISPQMSIEDKKQALAFKAMLLNLESEIAVANKNLRAIKSDTANAIKEKAYQEELLATTKTQVENLTVEHNKLKEIHLSTSSQLAEMNSEIATKKTIQEAKVMELKDREDKITALEKETHERHVNILNVRDDLNNDIRNYKEKIAKLKEVIALF